MRLSYHAEQTGKRKTSNRSDLPFRGPHKTKHTRQGKFMFISGYFEPIGNPHTFPIKFNVNGHKHHVWAPCGVAMQMTLVLPMLIVGHFWNQNA